MLHSTRAAAGCLIAVMLGASLFAATAYAQGVDVRPYVKDDRFGTIKLSPTGEYYAATVPLEDRTALAILRRSDNKVTGNFTMTENTHVEDFVWVNDTRVLIGISEKFGALDEPQGTGEIYAINADGTQADLLVGFRVAGGGLGTKIQPKKVERVAAFLVDDLPGDDRNVLISVRPFASDAFSRVDKMDVYTGRRVTVAQSPVRNASFTTDNAGVVRFASGAGVDMVQKTYYRRAAGDPWVLVNDESASGHAEYPLGFSVDNATAYLQVEEREGPDSLVAFDVQSQARARVLRDAVNDPARVLYASTSRVPVGALFADGMPRTAFIDNGSTEARLYRSLEAAFAGQTVLVTSRSKDGKLVLVQTRSDRNPGDYYVYDTEAKKAAYVISRREWFEPDAMATARPITVKARDGLELGGYLTLPKGASGKGLPMVVLPHGGPFGIHDMWGFDPEAQMLAEAGYAVLQVNFRGSGGRGRAFLDAGARQWGGTMQDDVTDATRWAIAEGIADPKRICIYGASYGAYAALMGAVREPSLYACAAGYVGVYDLPAMLKTGDIQRRGSGDTYLRDWLGSGPALAAASPNRMADRIRVPVLLAAGGRDERAPIEHSKLMERALTSAGKQVETLYYPNEGHGFYKPEHRIEFYTRLLAFLKNSLGGKGAATTPAKATAAQ